MLGNALLITCAALALGTFVVLRHSIAMLEKLKQRDFAQRHIRNNMNAYAVTVLGWILLAFIGNIPDQIRGMPPVYNAMIGILFIVTSVSVALTQYVYARRQAAPNPLID